MDAKKNEKTDSFPGPSLFSNPLVDTGHLHFLQHFMNTIFSDLQMFWIPAEKF